MNSEFWIPQGLTTPSEVWVPVQVKLWRRGTQYIAVVGSERDVKVLSPFVGKRVVLKLGEVYVDGTLLRTRHGNKIELVIVLPRRMALTWEALRAKGITKNGIIILRPQGNELYEVV